MSNVGKSPVSLVREIVLLTINEKGNIDIEDVKRKHC
jgi:hypothetical protein